MRYSLDIKVSALKKLKKMDKRASAYLTSWINKNLADMDNPRATGKPLQGDKNGLWRYRVGEYRIVADIQDDKVVILIVDVGHRKNIYR